MTEYFKAYTDDGYLVINDSVPNYHYKETKTLGGYGCIGTSNWKYNTSCAGNGTFQANIYNLGIENSSDLFYVYNPLASPVQIFINFAQLHYWESTSTRYFTDDGKFIAVVGCSQTVADNIQILRFTKNYSERPVVGMVCYNANHEITFSTESIPLKIVNYHAQVHTTKSNIYFNGGDWSFNAISKNYSYPIGVWVSASGSGGANTTATQTKNSFIYLFNKGYTLGYATMWNDEYSTVGKTEYQNSIARQTCPFTMFTIANLYGLV